MSLHSIKKYSGFSLIEVLVSLVLLAVGLLALSQAQVRALKNSHTALLHSQAINLAVAISDKMRSNRLSAIEGNYDLKTTDTPDSSKNCIGKGIICSQKEMAQFELTLWYKELTQTLPAAKASITRTFKDKETLYHLQLTWQNPADNQDMTYEVDTRL